MRIQLGQPYSFTQTGRRSNQEDARFPDVDKPSPSPAYYIVCDGVGGEEAGEIASRTVCDAFGAYMDKHYNATSFTTEDFSDALDYAYNALYRKGRNTSGDMATTLTFVCFHENGVLAAHIGDSRIYQIRPDAGIMYRSDDHSLVNAMVHSGNMTPEEAINNPQSNIITRCMECVAHKEDRAMATVMEITDVEAGDYFLLCTDGVLESVTDEEIVRLFDEADDEKKIKMLAKKAKGNSDNNTAYLIPVKNVVNTDNMFFSEDEPACTAQDTIIIGGVKKEATDVVAKNVPSIFDRIISLFKR